MAQVKFLQGVCAIGFLLSAASVGTQTGPTDGGTRRLLATIAQGLEPIVVAFVDGGRIVGAGSKDWFEAFATDGSHVAYLARQGFDHVLIVDNDPLAAGGMIRPPVQWCQGNRALAYALAVTWGPGQPPRWHVKIGAALSPPLDVVEGVTCSPDGTLVAYVARGPGVAILGLGNRRGGTHDAVTGPVVFGPSGHRVAMAAQRDGRWFVVLGDRTSKAGGTAGEPAFLPTNMFDELGDATAFKWALVAIPEQLKTPVEAVGPIALGVDRLVHAVKINGRWRFSGTEISTETYDEITAVAISPDDRRVAFAARTGDNHFVVLDGVKGPSFGAVASLIFSPDSKRFTYAAKAKETWAVFDGKLERAFGGVHSITFSPDSTRLAYVATVANNQMVVMRDAVEGPRFDRVSGLTFAADGRSVRFGARLDRSLWWITLPVR